VISMNTASVNSEPPAVGRIEVPAAPKMDDSLPTVPEIRQFWNPHSVRARWNSAVKRCFDVLVSGVGLLVLLPLLLVIAVMIRVDSVGPAFYRQTRVGPDGQQFGMLKFRTRRVPDRNAEPSRIPTLRTLRANAEKDPQVTNIGRFLRRYSLDELPQFWNVLVGDMSIVGPRPSLPKERHYAYSNKVDPYWGRLRAGITGLWQVSGRADLTGEESIRLDLYYLENWSLAGDMLILWRTVRILSRPDP
jgi:lipopolysaccharide/colanic/teichoic acid biosynthesis glycosyltransferase